jgi:hypothetical protein
MVDFRTSLLVVRPGIVAGMLGLVLAGCSIGSTSGVREALGLDKNPPDEFAVVTKAPLVVPPNYELRPPQEGASPLNVVDPRLAARETTFGGSGKVRTASRGEAALLRKAGAYNADGTIRRTLNKESAAIARKNRSMTSNILFWQKPDKQGAVIDAKAEAKRLKKNRRSGKRANDGTVKMRNCSGTSSGNDKLRCE